MTMKIKIIQDDFSDWPRKIDGVYLAVKASKSVRITLPPVGVIPTSPIVILGFTDHRIAVESVESDSIHGEKQVGSVTFRGANSRTEVINVHGEAWHVSSNVPLEFEQIKDMTDGRSHTTGNVAHHSGDASYFQD